jgi:hypothetical protein
MNLNLWKRPVDLLRRRVGGISLVWPAVVGLLTAVGASGSGREARAQSAAGPYPNYNWNAYYGMPYYNPGYAQYGYPGVGVSPWDPIVQAQLNLGLKTARYNMYSSWADQSNAAANLYYQQAMAQAIRNQQAQQTLQPRYDVRTREPRPVSDAATKTPKMLPKNEVLGSDGRVLWPASIPSSEELDKAKAAAEAAIRVAVKEFEANGKATVQSVAEAKSLLFAYGKPALQQLARANREDARKLLKFLASLEQVLNSLAGEA